jgi:hypothetical protein
MTIELKDTLTEVFGKPIAEGDGITVFSASHEGAEEPETPKATEEEESSEEEGEDKEEDGEEEESNDSESEVA